MDVNIMSENRKLMFFMGAFITSIIGGILLLVTPFGEFDASNYYLGVYIYGGIGAFSGVYGISILISAILLLYCSVMAVLVMRFPERIPDEKYIKLGFLFSLTSFILSIIGGIAFAAILTWEDAWWWFDAGFYGGIIGGLLTTIFYYFGIKEL